MSQKFSYIPEPTRKLMLKIVDDDMSRVEEYAYLLQYVYEHMPQGKNHAALEWCVQNKIIGREFLGCYFVEGKESPLEFVRFLTMKIHKRKDLQPIVIGRDLLA